MTLFIRPFGVAAYLCVKLPFDRVDERGIIRQGLLRAAHPHTHHHHK
jgi:hypothetical protein